MNAAILLLAVILFTLIGTGFGIITGLIPGIHVNNVALMVLALQATLIALAMTFIGAFNPSAFELAIIISALIIGCLVTHTFLDIIPSVYLGAPDADTALSVLPGHRLMLAGRGYEAIKCSALGSFGSVLVALVALIPARLLMGSPVYAYEKMWPFIPFILITIVTLLILNERGELPDPKMKRPIKLKILKITVGKVSKVVDQDENNGKEKQDLKENVELVLISEIPDHIGETIKAMGQVTKQANSKTVFMEDNSGEVLLAGWQLSDVEVEDRILVEGKVEGRVTRGGHVKQKLYALALFISAGFLGLIVLGAPGLTTYNWYPIPALAISASTALLFPLFTGLFGLSTLLMSLIDTPDIPAQKLKDVKINLKRWRKFRGVFSGTFAGGLVGWYPGVTGAQATVIAKSLAGGDVEDDSRKVNTEDMDSQKEFIVAYSGVNTANGIFNVIALYVILTARSGAMHAVQDIMEDSIVPWEPSQTVPVGLTLMVISVFIAAVCALFLTLYFGKVFAKIANSFPYRKMVLSVIILLAVMIFFLSGPIGMAIAVIAICMGIIPPTLGLSRVHLMGVLMFPIILYFLGWDTVILQFMGLI
jgi:TctA family transporter